MSNLPVVPDWKNADPERLEPHFSRWMVELTAQGLHDKGDIATVLAMLSAQVVELRKDGQWAKNELLEIMRIVGSALDQEDDISRLMKLHGIRLLVEADHVKYESLLDDAAKAGS